MRKITLFLSLLFAFVGATTSSAQEAETSPTTLPELTTDSDSPIYYIIKNTRKGIYVTYTGDASQMTLAAEITDAALFYFTGTKNDNVLTVKIHNNNTDNLCAGHSSWTTEGTDWYITATREDGLSISTSQTATDQVAWNDFNNAGQILGSWDANDAGSSWILEKVGKDIVYELNLQHARTLLNQYSGHTGDALFLPTEAAYNALSESINGTPSTDEEYLTETTKVKAAISAFNSSYKLPTIGQDYFIKNFERGGYLTIKGVDASTITPAFALQGLGGLGEDVTPTSDAVWTLEAGSTEGVYKFKNKSTGLYVESTFKKSGAITLTTNGSDFSFFPNDGERYASTAIGKSGEQYGKWHNDGSNNLVNWETTHATSWTFEVAEASDLPSSIASSIVEQAQKLAATFHITEDAIYAAALAAYNEDASYTKATALIQTAGERLSKHYYRIRSVATDRPNYIGTQGSNAHNYAEDNSNAGLIWQFVVCENGYKLRNVNTNTYISPVPSLATNTAYMTDETNGAKFTVAASDDTNTKFKFVDGDGGQMYCETNGNLNLWHEGDGALWYIFEATDIEVALHSANNAYYGTTYLPFAITPGDGVKAYTGSVNADKNELAVTEVSGTLPANQGYLLEGTGETATLNIAAADAETANVEGNAITGTLTADVATTDNHRVLGQIDGALGFYKTTQATLPANKAFIMLTDTQAVQGLKLNFGGEATGITGVETNDNDANAPLYDLSGRRVVNATKGVYIRAGKKVYIK